MDLCNSVMALDILNTVSGYRSLPAEALYLRKHIEENVDKVPYTPEQNAIFDYMTFLIILTINRDYELSHVAGIHDADSVDWVKDLEKVERFRQSGGQQAVHEHGSRAEADAKTYNQFTVNWHMVKPKIFSLCSGISRLTFI